MICYRYFLIGLVMVKILHEDIPAFSGQGIHGTIDFLLEFLILQISQRMGVRVDLQLLYRQVSGDYQRLAYIINDYQGVHFERLSF